MTIVLGTATLLASVVLPVTMAGAAALSNVGWWTSSTTAGATGVNYDYSLTVATGSNLSSVTMTVPSGTGGTPVVSSASHWGSQSGNFTGTSASLAGNVLTVSFSSVYLGGGVNVFLQIGGLTNGSAGSSTSTVTTKNGATAVDTGTSGSVVLTTSALTNAYWEASTTTTGATGVTDTYGFTTATLATLTSFTMTVPPGTAGTPTVGSVSPAAVAGGTVALSGQILTYTLASGTSVAAGTTVTIAVGGLTNTSVAWTYGGEVVTSSSGGAVDSAALGSLTFTTSALTDLSWSASATATGASGVAYTYDFTTATAIALQTITMTVPPGTGGTPSVGTVTVQPSYISLASPSVALSGTTLTFSFTSVYIPSGSVISIQITGLTNTSVAGNYTSSIATFTSQTYLPPMIDSGVAPAVTFSSTTLTSLSWSVSSTAVSATNVTYTLTFGLSVTSTLTSIAMSLPPGTAGTPTLTSASPPSISGGTLSPSPFSGSTLTYSFSSASISSSSTITLVIGGMTNTSTPDVYSSTVTASNGSSVVASGATPPVTFTATSLTSLSWGATSTTAGATGVAYTFGFTTASGSGLTAVTMTVPAGTGGTPAVGTVSVYSASHGGYITLTGQSVSLSLTTLTFSFTGNPYIPSGSVWSIEITGLTNTSSPGSYTSAITTENSSAAVDSGNTPALSFSSSVLGDPTWTVSSTALGGTNTTYTYGFVVQSAATVDTVTMTIPSGTAGTPAVGTVTPSAFAGGTVTRSAGLLTYSLPSAISVAANTTVSIAITGITNTSSAGAYTSTLIVSYQGTAIASGTTPSVTFTSAVLSALSWSVSSNRTSASGVTYTYDFTTGSTATVNMVTMTVPAGTGGTPTVGTVTPSAFAGGSVAWSGATTLVYSFTSSYVTSGTAVSIAIGGLTNPPTPGTSPSVVATENSGATVDSGTTPSVTFVGGTLANVTWDTDAITTGSAAVYTYSFSTASTSPLSSVTMTVPTGTGGTPEIGTVTPSALTDGATVSLVGTTLTYSFTSATISASTDVSIEITGLTNTSTAGAYTSTVTTLDGATVIDSGTSGSVTIIPPASSLAFTNSCGDAPAGCTIDSDGATQITLVALPGGTYATALVQLGVTSNLANGYRILAQTSPLTDAMGEVLAQGSASATRPVNAFYASAALEGSGSSGAALCSPYGSGTPYVGYGSSATSLWYATASTGGQADVVSLANAVQTTMLQPAGIYSGTISYTVQPAGSSPYTC